MGAPDRRQRTVSRRRVVGWALGGAAAVVVAGVGGLELVLHDVLPGHGALNRVDGACSLPATHPTLATPGSATSGTFASQARRRTVGYTIAYPPGHGPGSVLPLIVALHANGGDHAHAITGLTLAQALAMQVGGGPLPPMAMVSVDGGGGYWHAQPGDDPMGMLVDELIPMCRRLGLGAPPQRIGVIGTSMGGYGGLLLAEEHPGLVAAVAVISPAVWTGYRQAGSANAAAFHSAQDFAANDVIAHAQALAGIPLRIASGRDDPFHPGVQALIAALPPGAEVVITKGCHTEGFESAQQPDCFAFLARHLTAA